MIIALGSDHGGFKLKNEIKNYLVSKGIEVLDNGTFNEESCDYPFFGIKTANDVASGRANYGIVICTTGEGIAISANKVKGIRCAIAYNNDVTRLCRAHNNANMISFGQNYTTFEEAKERIDIFLSTEFEGGRHQRRVDEIENN